MDNVTKVCARCKKEFRKPLRNRSWASWAKAKYCSRACKDVAAEPMKNRCCTCGVLFIKTHNRQRVYKYCSLKCSAENLERRKAFSEKTKGKPAWNKGDKGRKPWMNISGLSAKEPWNKGKPNPHAKGEKNHNWKGGITSTNEAIRKSIEYKQWRAAVLKRDDYKCVFCGLDGRGKAKCLHADHIKPFAYYPELRFEITNGRTLCVECHKKTPTYFNKGRRKIHKKK